MQCTYPVSGYAGRYIHVCSIIIICIGNNNNKYIVSFMTVLLWVLMCCKLVHSHLFDNDPVLCTVFWI